MNTVADPPFQIVVGYDFSEPAGLALDQALALGRKDAPAVVHVLGVLSAEAGNELARSRREIDYESAEELQERMDATVRARAGDLSPDVRVFVHVRIGGPAEELLRLAGEAAVDLIIVGTHGRRGIGRLALGSVAEIVVRRAECPVLVMRPRTYSEEQRAEGMPEPPCPHCVARRQETGGAEWWCSVHAAPYVPPRRYTSRHGEMVELRDDVWALW